MNESKHEIPAPMLDAAFDKWFAASAGPLLSAQATDGTIAYTAWNAAIEAAGVAEMAARIAELEAELSQYQTSKFNPDWPVLQTTQENLREAWERIKELEAALGRIAKWFGEFPPTGRTWNDNGQGEEISYFACYGSNGERDYMRQVAASALKGAGGE